MQMAEVRPGNRAVVHHVIAFVRDAEVKWMRDQKPGESSCRRRAARNGPSDSLAASRPGCLPIVLRAGQGRADQGRVRHRFPAPLHGQRQGRAGSHAGSGSSSARSRRKSAC